MTPSQAAAIADQIEGWMFLDELQWIAEQAAVAQRWCELGVFKGRSLKAAALVCPEVVGVDVRQPPEIDLGVTYVRMASAEAAPRFPDAHFGGVFVDAEHAYEGVKADIVGWRSKVRPGGVLCGHDYDKPGVQQAVDELLGAPERGPGSIWFVRV